MESSTHKNIIEINQSEYETTVIKSDKPVIIDFYSSECSPCEALAPKFEDLALYFGEDILFVKIFRQENRELAKQLGISSSPTLLFLDKNHREVGKRLSGGIRKTEILENIKMLIPEDRLYNILSKKEKKSMQVDVAILGGGPAGLTAALYTAQSKLNTLVIDQDLPGGQVKTTHLISNYPGTGKAVSGWELSENMLRQVIDAGANVVSAVDVTHVSLESNQHKIIIDNEIEVTAKTVILAMGAEPRRLGVDGEKEYKGKGISYCATCDGKYYEGKEVVVIGGGNSAVEESLFLSKFVTKITIVHQFDKLQANKTAQEMAFADPKISFIWNTEPRKFELLQDGRMKITVQNIKTNEFSAIETDGIFVFVGMIPNTSTIQQKLDKNDWGYILTNEDMETNIKGVFAVGDIRAKKYRQAAIAVGEGCIAAIAVERSLANH